MSMDELLGSLLGGSQGESEASGGDMLSGLLGMLGGGGSSQGGGMMDILGALTGGGQAADQTADSAVSGISQQAGIPQELVMAGLSFLMGKRMGGSQQSSAAGISSGGMGLEELLQGLQGQQGGMSGDSSSGMGLEELLQGLQGQQGSASGGSGGGGMGLEELLQGQQGSAAADSGSASGGMNLDQLLQSMQNGQTGQYIESIGASQEFAQQTGLDADQASQSLQGILGALRGGA
jgi:hypothetical protein